MLWNCAIQYKFFVIVWRTRERVFLQTST